MCKVSVIIPAYNVEAFLPRCLNSVINSNNKDLQIIIVDDGSTDNTPAICDELAKSDERIKVIHKPNGGVSSARNAAIPLIEGEWVSFVDADDEVSPDLLTVDHKEADVIEKPYQTVLENGQTWVTDIDESETIARKYGIPFYFVNHRLNALWNKLISAKIVKGHRFDENFHNGEDMFFFITLLPEIKNYAFSKIGYYIYYRRTGSATTIFTKNREKYLVYYFAAISKLRTLHDTEFTDKDTRRVCRTLLYNIYVRNMYLIFDKLSDERKDIIMHLLRNMRWADLSLITFKHRLRIYTWHLRALLK